MKSNTISKTARKITTFLTAVNIAIIYAPQTFAQGNVANAAGFPIVKTLLESALFLIGGAIVIFGIVNFGMSFLSEDAEKKTKGVNGMIAGAVVLVAATLVATFFTGTAPTAPTP